MSNSKLSHSVDHENHPRGAAAASYAGVSDNPTVRYLLKSYDNSIR